MPMMNKALSLIFAILTGVALLTPANEVQAKTQKPVAPAKTSQKGYTSGPSCNAGVCISYPKQGMCVPGPDVTVKFCSWNLNSIPGADCLHIMLDNEPFAVHYNATRAHVFTNVAPGTHTIRLYACNAFHQAIAGAFDAVTFHVQYDNGKNVPREDTPMLTYNLPQGEYMGYDAENILVDFFVTPAPKHNTLATHIEYLVDGRRFFGAPDKTQALPKLAPGPHTVKVELVDSYGKRVPGPFNSVERTIIVSPEKSPAPSKSTPGYIQSIPGPATGGRYWISNELKAKDTSERIKQAEASAAGVEVNQETANKLMRHDASPEYNAQNKTDFSFRTEKMDGTQVRKVATGSSSDEEDHASSSSSSQKADTGDDGTIDRIRYRISRGNAPVKNRQTTETLVKVKAVETTDTKASDMPSSQTAQKGDAKKSTPPSEPKGLNELTSAPEVKKDDPRTTSTN